MEESVETLRALLSYEPATGRLTWRERQRHFFPSDRAQKLWNARWAGKEAFSCINGRGQRVGGILDKTYLAHRVVWAIVHGYWPSFPFNFANGDGADLSIGNLIPLPREKASTKSVRDGFLVRYHTGKKRWIGQYRKNGQLHPAGSFQTREEAVNACVLKCA